MNQAILLIIIEKKRKTETPIIKEVIFLGPKTINLRKGSCIKNKGNDISLKKLKKGRCRKIVLNLNKKSFLRTLIRKMPNPNSNTLFNGNHSFGLPDRIFDLSITNRDTKLIKRRKKRVLQGYFFTP